MEGKTLLYVDNTAFGVAHEFLAGSDASERQDAFDRLFFYDPSRTVEVHRKLQEAQSMYGFYSLGVNIRVPNLDTLIKTLRANKTPFHLVVTLSKRDVRVGFNIGQTIIASQWRTNAVSETVADTTRAILETIVGDYTGQKINESYQANPDYYEPGRNIIAAAEARPQGVVKNPRTFAESSAECPGDSADKAGAGNDRPLATSKPENSAHGFTEGADWEDSDWENPIKPWNKSERWPESPASRRS